MDTPHPEEAQPPILTMAQMVALFKQRELPPAFKIPNDIDTDNFARFAGTTLTRLFNYLGDEGWKRTHERHHGGFGGYYLFNKPEPLQASLGETTTESTILAFAVSQWGEKTLEGRALKLGEESGEVQGAISKLSENRATESDLDDELGDVLIVLSQIAAMRGTTLDALRAKRFEFIKARAQR